MKKHLSRFLCTIGALSLVMAASCRQEEMPPPASSQQPTLNKGQHARIEEGESAASEYEYFFYVDGVRYNRGNRLLVTAGQQLFVELRCQHIRQSRPMTFSVNGWSYNQQYIRFVRKYLPEYNNAIKYEVIAPWFAPGNFESRELGSISATFSALPGTSRAEQQPVYINVVQVGGGIQEPSW